MATETTSMTSRIPASNALLACASSGMPSPDRVLAPPTPGAEV